MHQTYLDITYCRCGHAADQHYAAPVKGFGVPYFVPSEKSRYPCLITGCCCADFQIRREQDQESSVDWRFYSKRAV